MGYRLKKFRNNLKLLQKAKQNQLVFIGSLLFFLLGVFFGFKQIPFKTSATSGTTWRSYDEQIREKSIKPAGKILEVILEFNNNALPKITILDIKQKNGYAPKPPNVKTSLALQLLSSSNKVLYSLPFEVPNNIPALPPEVGKTSKQQGVVLGKLQFALTVAFLSKANSIRIIDNFGKTIGKKNLAGIQKINNKPQFRSRRIEKFSSDILNRIITYLSIVDKSYAQTNDPNYLDLTFIGDQYSLSELEKFHTDVNRFISYLLTYEPFFSRATQLKFHYVDNSANLGCRILGDRLLVCDEATITSIVNNAGAPYDKIFVISNRTTYGGSGGNIATAYNGPSGTKVFVHEFGHSLSYLVDEYQANWAARTDRNCYNGTPPNPAWRGIVADTDYFSECNYPWWYRSSLDSIMRSLNAEYFNKISQKFLSDSIDYYAGSMPTLTPTPTSIITPTPAVTPTPSATPTLTPAPTSSVVQQSISLSNGWNYFGLSLATSPSLTAEAFLQEISKQGGSCDEVDRWQNGGWEGHVCGYTFNNFSIDSGMGYMVKYQISGEQTSPNALPEK